MNFTYLAAQISHSARCTIIHFVARGCCTRPIHTHLGILVEQAIALFSQRVVVCRVNTLERRLLQLLDLIKDLFLEGSILLCVLELFLESLVDDLLRLDLLILRSRLVLNFPLGFFLHAPGLMLLFFKLPDPRLLLLELLLEQPCFLVGAGE